MLVAYYIRKGKKPDTRFSLWKSVLVIKKKRGMWLKFDESINLIHLGLCKIGVRHTHRTFWHPPTHHRSLPSARTLIVPFSASIASTVAVQKWAEACKMNERDEKGHIVQQKRQWSLKISQYPILHHLQFNINRTHIREPHPIPQFLKQHNLHGALWQHCSRAQNTQTYCKHRHLSTHANALQY